MAFVKVIKTPQYYSRFQVKLRRRRSFQTNYHLRRRLIINDKDKYNTAKYRFVVRITNTKIVAQVVTATLAGDKILAAADSTELQNYGIEVGLKNYPAAYATGLLCARRVLKSLGLDKMYSGKTVADGSEYHIEEEDNERRPFRCFLDIGLRNRTRGGRVFGILKGAVDGGLHIPHSVSRFPGYTEKDGEGKYDAAVHRDLIFGAPIAKYMNELKSTDFDRYQRQFSQYIKLGIKGDDLESIYADAHKKIRANPDKIAKPKPTFTYQRKGNFVHTPNGTYRRDVKLDLQTRKARVQEKLRLISLTV